MEEHLPPIQPEPKYVVTPENLDNSNAPPPLDWNNVPPNVRNPLSNDNLLVRTQEKQTSETPIITTSHKRPRLEESLIPRRRPNVPDYISSFPPLHFIPTWEQLLPPPNNSTQLPTQKIYRLSLLNVQEFTIEGLSPRHDLPPTSILGLRVPIRQISRHHGKAVYQSGKWRIPLAAYHDFAGYLQTDGATVYGIPPNQLQIASLERARLDKGYPTPEQLQEYGVPPGLAAALAPFQRGGVDFVREKQGRALIADDMGLGKTIQGVASMAMYWQEWPLLVLCPSGARYHWESEFQQWLGTDSRINHPTTETTEQEAENGAKGVSPPSSSCEDGPLLRPEQIHVLTSAKSPVLPSADTKVVICSYGLSSVLIESKKLWCRQFRCAIVDESHMLKNKATKRTSLLLPILNATDRCVLLSGTPALAKPLELWPQLAILGTEQHGWGAGNEDEFIDKYVKNGSTQRSAELHTMLRGTVMIRRLKNDILKTLPRKVREKAEVHVIANEEQRSEFKKLLTKLRESKGALGQLARLHQAEHAAEDSEGAALFVPEPRPLDTEEETKSVPQQLLAEKALATEQLNSDVQQQWTNGQNQIRLTLEQRLFHLETEEQRMAMFEMEEQLRNNLRLYADEKFRAIEASYSQQLAQVKENEEQKRTSLLSRLYSLTGEVKIPLIVDSLKRWLADPTKGKVCVFAHHLSVLDAIQDGVGLSNDGEDRKPFIRIDGSTLPKLRQEQIAAFQNDLSIRVALLGITAAGVAVTLTASSTVWFTELFWTPAIMIQAEDRCHRIGQNAQVNCLYFVAKGTLDDVLWKLLEKKFRDLGEFVEGKEKLKLVVNTVYQGHKEFHAAVFNRDAFDDSDSQSGEDDIDFSEEMQMDNDLFHDIEELGEEEKRMLHVSDPDVDDGDNAVEPVSQADDVLDAKPSASDNNPTENGMGTSEDDAISLSDDENESPEHVKVETSNSNERSTSIAPQDNFLADCRLYRIVFNEAKLGLDVVHYEGRIIVSNIRAERILQFGMDSKPSVGDILCGIDGQTLGLIPDLAPTTAYLKALLYRQPVEVLFLEAPKFVAAFRMIIAKKKRNDGTASDPSMGVSTNGNVTPLDHAATPENTTSRLPVLVHAPQNDVIELLDDD